METLSQVFTDIKMPTSQMLKQLVLQDSVFAKKTRYIKTTDSIFYASADPIQSGTWSFNSIEKNIPTVNEACMRLSAIHGKRVQCNAYFTPMKAQGLPVHYDLHDILVFQLEGSKKWKVWPAFRKNVSVKTLLSDENENLKNWTSMQTPRDLILTKSGSLYLAKGEPHVAVATNEDSFHLSFGVYNE